MVLLVIDKPINFLGNNSGMETRGEREDSILVGENLNINVEDFGLN